jgi:LysM repeat protein
MNNDNPLVPQGSLLEQKNKSRSRVKTAFFCVLAVHVLAILTALIAQGCKREPVPLPPEPQPPVPTFDTNTAPVFDPNLTPAPLPPTAELPPQYAEPQPPEPQPQPPAATEHVVAAGDSFYSIGKQYGVSMKAIADANPGVEPTRLKVGQRLNIPAATTPVVGATTLAPVAADSASTQIYTVKSGDNLTKIANKHGVTVKALRSANNLTTDRILVGDKLKIPGKAPAPVPAPEAPAALPLP